MLLGSNFMLLGSNVKLLLDPPFDADDRHALALVISLQV